MEQNVLFDYLHIILEELDIQLLHFSWPHFGINAIPIVCIALFPNNQCFWRKFTRITSINYLALLGRIFGRNIFVIFLHSTICFKAIGVLMIFRFFFSFFMGFIAESVCKSVRVESLQTLLRHDHSYVYFILIFFVFFNMNFTVFTTIPVTASIKFVPNWQWTFQRFDMYLHDCQC